MKIVLVTPLYPPEIGGSAPYVKELAKRLSQSHQVTIIAYTHLPEKIPGVRIISVNKRRLLPLRLLTFFLALEKETESADVVYAENGPSIELPIIALVLFFRRCPIIMHMGDSVAHEKAKKHFLLRTLERRTIMNVRSVITDVPPTRPEIIPLEPYPDEMMHAYEKSWNMHVITVEKSIEHAIR